MVLAEMIASGELAALAQPGAEPAARHSLHKTGAILSDGIALGHVVLHEPRVVITNYIAEDLPKEVNRLDAALTKLRADLDRMLERGDVAEGGEHREVLEAYRMFANDHGWSHKLHEAVATGLTAEAAVERVQSDTRARMLRSTDPYLRDRLHDLEDLGHRLMRQLVGQDHAPSREQLPDNAILIARAMGPAALLDYDRKRLRGLVLEEGTANSHVSIVARALGIPAVGEVPNAPGIADPGDAIIVDGTSGSIYIRPSAEIESAYAERVRFRARRRRPRAAHHVSDDHRSRRIRFRKGDRRARTDLSASARPRTAGTHRRRHHGGSAGAALSARRTPEEGRFRLGGIQRPVSVLVCGRSRQCQGLRTVRHHVCPDLAGIARDRAEGERGEEIRFAMRRDGVKTARRAGVDRIGLPLAVAVGHCPRPGQGADPRPRRQKGRSCHYTAARCAVRQRVDPRQPDRIDRARVGVVL